MKYRTLWLLKMIVGFIIAYLIAVLFKLDYVFSAGVITILSLEPTRKRSYRLMIIRALAAVIALGLLSGLIALLGFHFYVVIIFLVIFIPLVFILKIESGIVLALVAASQPYVEADLSYSLNALAIVAIGMAVAFLLNLIMIDLKGSVKRQLQAIDTLLNDLLMATANQVSIDCAPIRKLIDATQAQLVLEIENHASDDVKKLQAYLTMRSQQVNILEQIAVSLAELSDRAEKQMLLDYIRRFDGQIGEANYAAMLQVELTELLNIYRQSPLPTSRTEFEERAELLHLLNSLSSFLKLKETYHLAY